MLSTVLVLLHQRNKQAQRKAHF